MNVAAILKLKGPGVVTTPPATSLLDIAKLLDEHHIGCVVVATDDGKVVGIVSERDIVCAIGQSGAQVLKQPVDMGLPSDPSTHCWRRRRDRLGGPYRRFSMRVVQFRPFRQGKPRNAATAPSALGIARLPTQGQD